MPFSTQKTVDISFTSMAFRKWKVYVFCSQAERISLWHNRALIYKNLDIEPIIPALGFVTSLNNILETSCDDIIVVCRDTVFLPFDFSDILESLYSKLNKTFKSWGVCGNYGVSCSGKVFTSYVFGDKRRTSFNNGPEPCLWLGDDLLVINAKEVKKRNISLTLKSADSFWSIYLCLECLKNGLLSITDPSLFIVSSETDSKFHIQSTPLSHDLTKYLSFCFLDNSFPLVNGDIFIPDNKENMHTIQENDEDERVSRYSIYDNILRSTFIRKPSISIICRTQLKRYHLLLRAMNSFRSASILAKDLVDIEVVLVSDQPVDLLNLCASKIINDVGTFVLKTHHVSESKYRFSRVAAIISAVQSVETSHTWFIDDDDFVCVDTIREVARNIYSVSNRLLVGNSVRFSESWHYNEGRIVLRDSIFYDRLKAENVYSVFSGENGTPVCSVIYPTYSLKAAFSHPQFSAKGDFFEDYFILLSVISRFSIDVIVIDIDFAFISLRGSENTVNSLDRDLWNLSYATFLSEIRKSHDLSCTFAWNMRSHLKFLNSFQ